MNNNLKVNNHDLAIKTYRGQPVVTFNDIDIVHERPEGTAKRNFNKNKKRFIDEVDYFIVKKSDFQKDEIRTLKITV